MQSSGYGNADSTRLGVRSFIRYDHDFKHGSYLLLGLLQLADSGEIDLEFVPDLGKTIDGMIGDGGTFILEVDNFDTGLTRKIAIDIYDRSDEFCSSALSTVDVYFKRSLYRPDIASISTGAKAMILPFGLHLPCIGKGLRRRMLAKSLRSLVSASLRGPVRAFRGVRRASNAYHQFFSLPFLEDFQQPPSAELEHTIVYQTRVWPPEDMAPDNAEEVNGERIALVRGLRKEFGKAFVGGLVPTDYARRIAPDAITDKPTRNRDYIRLSRRNLIAVYTRGLHHSMALKLPEYLAASQCVLASPLRNELPTPLVPGEHYCQFRSLDECMSDAHRIMDDAELARGLRESAFQYYREEIYPEARMRHCLRQAFTEEKTL